MRHGYGGKYLKELHKSALYQRQGFGKDACKFGKGIFFIFFCGRSNISPYSSAFSQSMEDLCVSAIKKQPTAQCHFLCDLCMPGALIFPWQKAEQALSLVENSKRRGVKVNNCLKKKHLFIVLDSWWDKVFWTHPQSEPAGICPINLWVIA